MTAEQAIGFLTQASRDDIDAVVIVYAERRKVAATVDDGKTYDALDLSRFFHLTADAPEKVMSIFTFQEV